MVFVALYLLSSLYLMFPFSLGVTGSGYTGLDTYPYGHPQRPVAYRVLMPWVARGVHAAVPDAIEKPLTEKLIAWRDSKAGQDFVARWYIRHPPLNDDVIFETAVVAFVCYLSLLAFIGMFFTLASAMFPGSAAYAYVAPLIAMQAIAGFSYDAGYIYDFAELFFSCACLYLMFRRRWGLYLLALGLGTLNKETTIFGIFLFAAWFWKKLPRGQFIRLMVMQCAIYAAIRGSVMLYFAGYPGIAAGDHFMDHVRYLRAHAPEAAVWLPMIAFFLTYKWREKPAFLKAGLLMLIPHLAAFSTCEPGEYRDLYWSMPVMWLLATHTLLSIAGIADLPVFADAKKAA